ncbi:MAG: cupin [Zetaproteobacteria bacterium CG2_30_46_52]|nr:MAG: cupin [Zetaproteobacteria bacterium CG2_30_46_52]
MKSKPVAASEIEAPQNKTIYPAPFAHVVNGRSKRKIGEAFGLTNFGVNFTTLAPGAASALPHHHSKQDEFIYIVNGTATLKLGHDEFIMHKGDCMGFKAGTGLAHQLSNQSALPVTYLEIGDRTEGDEVDYPFDDLKATQLADGVWSLTHKNGSPYTS